MFLIKILIFSIVLVEAVIFRPPSWKNVPPPVNQNRVQSPEFLNYVGSNYKVIAENVGLKLDNSLANIFFASRSRLFIDHVSKAISTLTLFGSSEQLIMNSLLRSEASKLELGLSIIQRISKANTRRPTGNSIELTELPEFTELDGFTEDSEPIIFNHPNTVGRSFYFINSLTTTPTPTATTTTRSARTYFYSYRSETTDESTETYSFESTSTTESTTQISSLTTSSITSFFYPQRDETATSLSHSTSSSNSIYNSGRAMKAVTSTILIILVILVYLV